MDPKSMILRTVDDFELDVETRLVGLEREPESNRERRLRLVAALPIMAESAEDREIVACLQAGPEWSLFQQFALEIADRIGRLRVISGRREVVLIAGVPFIDQPVQPLVAHSSSPVENREGAVGTEIAHKVDVLEPRSARGNGPRGGRGRHRTDGDSGGAPGGSQGALGVCQTRAGDR